MLWFVVFIFIFERQMLSLLHYINGILRVVHCCVLNFLTDSTGYCYAVSKYCGRNRTNWQIDDTQCLMWP